MLSGAIAVDLGRLAEDVYNFLSPPPDGWALAPDICLPIEDSTTGFAAATYRGPNGIVCVAFRGSGKEAQDWSGPNPAFGGRRDHWDPQFEQALEYVDAVIAKVARERVYVTGHSLGGGLAQVAAYAFGLDGVALDPPGAQNIVNNAGYKNYIQSASIQHEVAGGIGDGFVNYPVRHSVVSGSPYLTNDHIGAVRPLDTLFGEAFGRALQASYTVPMVRAVLVGIGAPLLTFFYLHDKARIVELMETLNESGHLVPGTPTRHEPIERFAQESARDYIPLLETGDVVSPDVRAMVSMHYLGGDQGEVVDGTNAGDVLRGQGGADVLIGFDGDDLLDGGEGDDVLVGSSGNDRLLPGTGSHVSIGGPGNDLIEVVARSHTTGTVEGGPGIDTLTLDISAVNDSVHYEFVAEDGSVTVLDNGSGLDAVRTALVSAQSYAITGPRDYHRTEFSGIEHVNLVAGNGPALVVFQGGGSYRATQWRVDTFYANWSDSSNDIVWVNSPDDVQLVNGVSLQGMERLLLLTGSGNDTIVNPVSTFHGGDELHTGDGNDTVNAGPGNDYVDLGPGDDVVTVVGVYAFATDVVNGGPGTDTLSLDLTAVNGDVRYEFTARDGTTTELKYTARLDEIRDAASGSVSFAITSNRGDHRTEFTSIERVNLVAGDGPALVVFQGGDDYRATQWSVDTFCADWSDSSADIVWVNQPDNVQLVNGVSLQGMERLLLLTGSGNDTLVNQVAAFHGGDELHTAAGNDSVEAGPGNDVLDLGSGDDWADPGPGVDSVFGGEGVDTVALPAIRSAYSVSRNASELRIQERTGRQEIDTLKDVERVAYSDLSVAYDLDGNAGMAAKVLGALFGASTLRDEHVVGIALKLIDSGMSYLDLLAFGASHEAFIHLAGSASNSDFVRLVYRNVVGADPTGQELAGFVALLENGSHSRATLAYLAAETELNAVNVNLSGLVESGLEYVPA